ncbi:peptidoglycan -binding protein [Pseudogemmobacter sp. W21_MBD1_M6]|uniref:peptidoglycan -binding protein n=1 Tax=Pseudogemmobacter sp. W21_MBD1_M6 TaxID=3240271 RepID=UPI003F9BDA29
MALSRRTGQRLQSNIWPGFVDAMTALLLVLMFVLTIFMVVQFVLREQISGQETELDNLGEQVRGLAQALGLENRKVANLEDTLAAAQSDAERQLALIATLTAQTEQQGSELAQQRAAITSFEAQVANLLAERDRALGQVADLETAQTRLLSDQEALNLALARARDEIDANTEAARLAAARRAALDALVADLRARAKDADETGAVLAARVSELQEKLTEEEASRLAEAEAARLLRERLANADTELTAMTLALEEQRRRAEETLTLLAAAEATRETLNIKLAAALSDVETQKAASADRREIQAQLASALAAKLSAEQTAQSTLTQTQERAALLAAANKALSEVEAKSAEDQRKLALLNEQVAALRTQLGSLQAVLDASASKDAAAQVQLEALGSQLNTALARVASEEKRRAELEEAERKRLEAEAQALAAEAKDLARYRSEFFGRLRDVLGAQEGVRIEGDRFVFSSEVLFQTGEVNLSEAGKGEIAKVAAILRSVSGQIPPEIDWIIRVDGHTDNVPLSGLGKYRNNWELSQGRALSVVQYMVDFLGIPPNRLAATGFGEFQPVSTGTTPEARAQNRRIELKFTEK